MREIKNIRETHNSFGDQIFTITFSDGTEEREVFQEGDWHTESEVRYVLTGERVRPKA